MCPAVLPFIDGLQKGHALGGMCSHSVRFLTRIPRDLQSDLLMNLAQIRKTPVGRSSTSGLPWEPAAERPRPA
jgi:hypothetical protein